MLLMIMPAQAKPRPVKDESRFICISAMIPNTNPASGKTKAKMSESIARMETVGCFFAMENTISFCFKCFM